MLTCPLATEAILFSCCTAVLRLPNADLEDISNLEGYIERSEVVFVYCSRGYFSSRNCMRELRASVQMSKLLIPLLEPEAAKGGLTVVDIREQTLEGFRDDRGTWHTIGESYVAWGFTSQPSPHQLVDALLATEPIEWNRIGVRGGRIPTVAETECPRPPSHLQLTAMAPLYVRRRPFRM